MIRGRDRHDRDMWTAEQREFVDAHDLIVNRAITAAGGRVTDLGQVVVPFRPPGWSHDEWPSFAVMDPQYVVPKWHLVIENDEIRDAASAFLEAHMGTRTNVPGGVLVLCPAV